MGGKGREGGEEKAFGQGSQSIMLIAIIYKLYIVSLDTFAQRVFFSRSLEKKGTFF